MTTADCPAGYHVLIGTSADGTLTGTSGSDCIFGLGGNDVISGGGGDDFLVGGEGSDVIRGGNGADTVYGEDGDDSILGESGADSLDGGNGDDSISGGGGADVLHGGPGRDSLSGDEKDDVLHGGDDDDSIHGGGGSDLAFGDGGDDVVAGDTGGDELHGGPGDDIVYGDAGHDTLFGEEGDDVLLGGPGNNPTDGGPGIDACSGTSCEKAPPSLSGCTDDSQCESGARCILDLGLCHGCVSDQDSDLVCDSKDGCPTDGEKVSPGACGCGVFDADSDHDGNADCIDLCPGWPDHIDDNGNGIPDGCEEPTPCGPDAIGRGIHRGDAYISTAADAAALTEVTCITGSLWVWGDVPELSALSALTEVVGGVWIQDNTELQSLDGLEQLARIGGVLVLDRNAALTSVQGLRSLQTAAGLGIHANSILTTLAGLEALGVIEGGLGVSENPLLADVSALLGITQLGSQSTFNISYNASLPACQAWAVAARVGRECRPYDDRGATSLDTCTNNLGGGSCGELPPDFVCEPGATGPGVFSGTYEIAPLKAQPDAIALSGLSCVTGNLLVDSASLTDLSALGSLKLVGGDLIIQGNATLTSLDGLDALRAVGGVLTLRDNPLLADVSALELLTSIGEPGPDTPGIRIHDNAALSQCQAWDIAGRAGKNCVLGGNECHNNTGTSPCAPLPDDFACVPGARGPGVLDEVWLGLYGLDSGSAEILERMRGVRCITQGLQIDFATTLEPLSDLQMVGMDLFLWSSDAVTSLEPLSKLTHLGGMLYLAGYQALESLDGLRNLRPNLEPRPLLIAGNDLLPACEVWALQAQTNRFCADWYCSGNRGAGDCGTLPPDFACEPGAVGPGVFDGALTWVDGAGYAGLTCVTGNLTLDGTQLSDLTELGMLEAVGGHLTLRANTQLQSVDGFENLTRVAGALRITEHPALSDVSGLSSLTSLGTSVPPGEAALSVWANASLPACWVGVLEQQTGQSCGGPRACDENDGAGTCAP